MKRRNPVARASQQQRPGAGRHKNKHWYDRRADAVRVRKELEDKQWRDSPDGYQHDGDVFWVHRSEIKTMQVESDAQQE